jgi:hypothetical protein
MEWQQVFRFWYRRRLDLAKQNRSPTVRKGFVGLEALFVTEPSLMVGLLASAREQSPKPF